MKLSVDTNKHFARSVKRLIRKYGDPLAKLNGFSDSQLDYTEFISNFIDTDTVADASIDGNANVGHKDIVTLINEMPKPHEKVLAFNKIYCEIEKEYGRKTADKWLKAEWCGYLYTHDSNSASWVSYCFAYDLKDLAEKGLFFIDDFNAEPPKHLETFVDFVKEFVSWNCNRTSGAVGLPNLIPYMYYFWKKDKEAGIFTDDEKARRQQIQRLIYGLNQPFLRGRQNTAR